MVLRVHQYLERSLNVYVTKKHCLRPDLVLRDHHILLEISLSSSDETIKGLKRNPWPIKCQFETRNGLSKPEKISEIRQVF